METKASFITVGIFTMLVLTASLGFIYWAANVGQRVNLVPMNVRIAGTVTGLAAGSEVFFNGIKVGKVDRVVFDKDDPRVVYALTSINADTPVRTDTTATIASQGLTGVAYISLAGGSPTAKFLLKQDEEGTIPQINANPSAFADILETVRDVAGKADKALTSLEGLISDNRQPLTTTFKNVEIFSQSLANNAAGVDKFLASAAGLGETVAKLSEKLDGTIVGIEKIVEAVDADKVKSTITNVETFSQNLKNSGSQIESVMASVQKISGELQTFSAGLSVSLGKVEKVIDAVDSEKVKTAITDIGEAASGAKSIVASAKTVTETFANRREDIDRIISNAGEMTKRLNESSKRVDGVLTKLDGFLGSGDASGVMADARTTLQEFRNVAINLNAKINQISTGLTQFSGSGLKDVEALVNDARRSISRIDRVIGNLERDPSGFLSGKSEVKTYNGVQKR